MKKILLITDTTSKQTNGVVRTLGKTVEILSKEYQVEVINPSLFRTIPLPFYKEIDFSINTHRIGKMIEECNPNYIHIATEGPVGLAGKLYCDRKGYRYTTSYHSMFPEFIQSMFKVPSDITYPYFKWFHSKSSNVLVPTNQTKALLESHGFTNTVVWRRGVDRSTFNSEYRHRKNNPHNKFIVCVSRVSKEKGLDDFCQMPVGEDQIKILVGDGPYLSELNTKHTAEKVQFLGKRTGLKLSEVYASADVFVFPSKTDTFGLTQLEAMASGTPILAYTGTVSDEIITEGVSGHLVSEFTIEAIEQTLKLDRTKVEAESEKWTWESCTEIFTKSLIEKT